MSRDNEPLSSLTHLIATILSIVGGVILIVFAGMYGTARHVVSFSIFSGTLVSLYLMSTIYHFLPRGTVTKKVFQILDHSTIYLLIAGTYTPVLLLALPPSYGWSIFGVIWGMAVIGILKKALQIPLPPWVSSVFYLIMGWLIIIATGPLGEKLSHEALLWLFSGGLFYTVGVIFFALDSRFKLNRWYTLHDVFHIFVMLGSACHFWFMFKYILPL